MVRTVWNREPTRNDIFFGLLLLALVLVGNPCPAIAQKAPADLVIVNARVRTFVGRESIAAGLAVSHGRISAVGSEKSIRRLVGSSTRVIDADGRLVLPGFNDAHVHFMGIGNIFSSIDLRDVKTAGEINERIAHYVRFLPKGRWILGGGWSTVTPDWSSINKITRDNPVFIYQAGGQGAFANTIALNLAGASSAAEESGIVRGETLRRIARAVPVDHTRNWLELAETATNYAASLGVTSVQDVHSDDIRAVYRELQRKGRLHTRVYDCLSLPDWRKLDEFPQAGGDAMVHSGCLKSFADSDESSSNRILRDAIPADKAGYQIMVHAIGNAANTTVLDVFEEIIRTNGARDRRLRVEHAQNPRLADLPRFGRSGILASMQPRLFDGGNGGYYSSLLKLKASIAFGSDASITDLNPLLGIHAAVNAGAESISVYDAVLAYTIGSAYAEFREKEKGTIEVGKLADFVILSDDIFSIPSTRIREVSVKLTVVGGRIVYSSDREKL